MGQTKFVIDANIAFKLLVTEHDSAMARRLMVRASIIFAPDFIMLETANALWRFARQRDEETEARRREAGLPLHEDRVKNAKDSLEALAKGNSIEFVDSEPLALKAVELAIELDHPVYDCAYLALAMEEDAPLVTSDGKFRRKLQHTPYAHHVLELAEADAL